MQEEFFRPERITVIDVALFVGTDMHPLDPDFAFPDLRPALLEIDSSLPDAFDFGAEQRDAAFVFFLDEIIVPRLAVLRDGFDSLLMRQRPLRVSPPL